ncbi:putative PEP-binding protein, partial [Oleiphilus sp. HI0067]
TQYLLAVDRNNPRVAPLYHSFHPAVLQALYKIAQDSKGMHVQLSICGELAGDPAGALLLMAMGYDALSMNASNLLRVKAVLRGVSLEWAQDLLKEVLMLDSSYIVESTLTLALKEAGFDRFLRRSRLAEVKSSAAL